MKEFSLLKIYLVIIAIVWLIWAVTWYGNLGYQAIKYKLITPQEYLIWSYDAYQIKQCEDPIVVPSKESAVTSPAPTTTVTQTRTPEEIQKCKDEARTNILAKRDYDYKDSIISGVVWWSIFLILFLTHFPVFFKKYKEDRKK
ncbi:MAG: hypothetical protein ACD_2C00201G0011 [uncultured bacterium (gcode 4)]|uniref:Uncharacterized protein n=1 Tax=uncultured bacterium (gcode 4) TaxID=1234023 RepID=K2GFY4_9BACT|nr:MAG: hypothetical protein ACD_2C00201G0011 [uncultured bacterium (gcode 4)]